MNEQDVIIGSMCFEKLLTRAVVHKCRRTGIDFISIEARNANGRWTSTGIQPIPVDRLPQVVRELNEAQRLMLRRWSRLGERVRPGELGELTSDQFWSFAFGCFLTSACFMIF